MAYQQIQADAVLAAITEFDQLGREEFLKRYGFGPAQSYFLFYNGKYYDSKALLGVAHRFQFPELGILPSKAFSGGENTVKSHLEEIGFNIEVRNLNSVRNLTLFDTYDRREVHSIFSPMTRFTPQAGTWGLQGIVDIPDRPGDFVFFVTIGRQQGEHVFDEGITQDGVLSWQSQPQQSFTDRKIHQLIQHDELFNSIHLFLRTGARDKYTYLGLLKYLSHDGERERPVYFQWQLLSAPIPEEVLVRMNLALQQSTNVELVPDTSIHLLVQTPVPFVTRQTQGTRVFRTRKVANYAERDAKNRQLGRAGELLAMQYEKEQLVARGRQDLADQIIHVSEIVGDGAGYDIHSFEGDGSDKFIEVKTTRGGSDTEFFISANEVAFSQVNPEQFHLYRIYEFDEAQQTGKFYSLRGTMTANFELVPTQYRATPR